MSDNAEWLAGLKVGDEVVVHWSRYPTNRNQTQKVARMTDTLIVTDGRLCFRRQDGYPPGEFKHDSPWLIQPTAAQAERAKP